MLVTLYKIDTVLVEKSNDYLTRKEVIEIFDSAQGNYDTHINIFLVLLGLGIAVFGFIIPRMINKNIEKSEKSIEKEIDRFDSRINKTIENKIQSELELQVINYRNEFDKKLNESLKSLKNETQISIFLAASHTYFLQGHYHRAMNNLLDATIIAIKIKDIENLKSINNNLNTIKEKIIKRGISTTELVPDIEYSDTKVKMLYLSKDDNIVREIVNDILATIDDIFKLSSE